MKNILFFNTTKLAVVLKRTLTVLTLCIISALCIQAEESTIEPSDSIAVTGPKKSHWQTGFNFIVDTRKWHNEHDFAQVKAVVKVYNEDGTTITDEAIIASIGKVSLAKVTDNGATGTVETISPAGSSAYINWHCNTEVSDNKYYTKEALEAAHKLKVKLTAALVEGNKDYVFAGWSTNETWKDYDKGTHETFEHTSNIANGGSGYGSYATRRNDQYEGSTRYPETFYAKFVPVTPTKVTLAVAENGTYHYSTSEVSGDVIDSEAQIESKERVSLTATSESGYKFFGWYTKKGSQDIYFSYDSVSTSPALTQDTTIYAKFIPADWATYIVKGEDKRYFEFDKAEEAAAVSSSKVFLPIIDGIVPYKEEEGYSIRSGVTLLIPYNDEHTIKSDTLPQPSSNSATHYKKNVVPYVTLTLSNNVNIDVYGAINVAARQYATGGTYFGGVWEKYGFIDMKSKSTITLNNGASLYCWGYISGEGEVIAKSGSTVYEMFQIVDFRGGSRTVNDYEGMFGNAEGKTKKVFPINSYYIQNIEALLTLHYGSTLNVRYALYMSNQILSGRNKLVANTDDAMFQLSDGNDILRRKYDPNTDRINYELFGKFLINKVSVTAKITLAEKTITSSNYVLPLNSNMTILVKSGSNFSLTQDMALLPGAEIYLEEGATATIKSGKNLYTYDKQEWVGHKFIMTDKNVKQLGFVAKNHNGSPGTPYERIIDKSAKLQIDGTFIVEGAIYTTKSGADICSDKSGKIKFNTASGTKTETYQDSLNQVFVPVPITAAQLHNDESKTWNQDDKYKYTPTAGAVANDVFTYSETYGRWRCERTITWEANGGTIEPTTTIVGRGEPLSLYFPESLPTPTRVGYTFNGWFTAASGGTQITTETIVNDNVTYYAQWRLNIVGTPLDIVDADDTNLTINANGWASSGWPYTVSVVTTTTNTNSYEKTARQSDRTLKVPYSGDLNADMQIIVTNTSGTVSNHIYKVPFVYTGTEDMSDMNENSIVFVKSGTLTVGTASAKEIYVADSAELKVTGTLTVGKLVLRTTPYKAAILTNNGTINGQVYYSRISPNSEQYYQFGLPLSCELANVKMSNTDKLGGSQPKYGTAWMLKSYSESSRANNGIKDKGANWSLLPSNGTITAGVGYEMFSNSNYYREFYFPVDLTTATNKVSVQYTDGTIAEHNGWNIITSPLTSRANVPIIDPATDFKVCWLNEDGSYRQELPTVFPPAIPFSIQASAGGELNFAVPTIAAAPRKQSAAEALTETEWVHLDIFDAYGEGDETSLFIHPTRFEQTYKTGIDMAKQSLTASRAILYTTHAYGDMAFAGVADSLLENGIDLIVYSPAEQELTISLRENAFLNRLEYLWLADNETGARTDLLMNDYTFRADAGTAKGRFVLNGRFKAPQIATGIGNTQTDYNIYAIGNNIAISGVEQGTPIYVFDAVGHMIYTTAATTAEVIVPAPCAGVYMLTIGGQTAKLVINQ